MTTARPWRETGVQIIRKRPLDVRAIKVCDENLLYLLNLESLSGQMVVERRVAEGKLAVEEIERVVIATMEGDMIAYPDQHWIIQGVHGELYPITEEVLLDSYEFIGMES